MKKTMLATIVLVFAAIFLCTGCQKETPQNDAAILQSDALLKERGTVTAACASCEASAKTVDLLDQLKTTSLTEGNNVIAKLNDGSRIIAQVKKGLIVQWIMQTKSGTVFTPSSETNTKQMMRRIGTNYPIFRICFYLDGLYNCWLVIKII